MSESNEGNGSMQAQEAPAKRGPEGGTQPEAFARVQQEPPPREPKKPFYKRPLVLIIGGLIVIGAIVGGILWWLNARQFESTDDAFIAANVTQVSPRVAGHVQAVFVRDNQAVEEGQKLVQLDPRDYQAKLDQAKAALMAAERELQAAKDQASSAQAQIGQASSAEDAAQTEANRAHSELQRYEKLTPEAVTQQQMINLRAAAAAADAQLAAARQKTTAARANAASAESQIQVAAAHVQQAKAAVAAAELELSYTRIDAPIAGTVTNKSVHVGDYVQAGQAMMALVPHDVYVIANFKETQLTRMKPGQPVEITVDAFPDHTFHGTVDSIQRGSGAAFSLLPPENATGNYVKVVQRVPVKIRFDSENVPLGPGMSVVPKVKVQ